MRRETSPPFQKARASENNDPSYVLRTCASVIEEGKLKGRTEIGGKEKFFKEMDISIGKKYQRKMKFSKEFKIEKIENV